MAPPGGYNPIRWDCRENGCFNLKLRPKIEMFSGCFPGNINFSDLDGFVERDSAFLILEWKAEGVCLPRGQQIAFQNFSRIDRSLVVVVNGDPQTMKVSGYSYFWKGEFHPFREHSFEELFEFIKSWSAMIDKTRNVGKEAAA